MLPIFFASICLVLGVTASLAASVVGYHLPSSADAVRRRYRFVGNPSFPQRVAGAGLICAGSGLLLDGGLLAAWLAGAGSPALRLTLAGLAQGAILTGAIIALFALLYRLLLDLRDVPRVGRAAGTGASSPENPVAAGLEA